MRQPVLLAVDDDRDALDEVEAQLSQRYSHDYRVESLSEPDAALRKLQEFADAGEDVALVLASAPSTRSSTRPSRASCSSRRESGASFRRRWRSWARPGRAAPTSSERSSSSAPHSFCLASSDRGRQLIEQSGPDAKLPLMVLPDGQSFSDPSNAIRTNEMTASTARP